LWCRQLCRVQYRQIQDAVVRYQFRVATALRLRRSDLVSSSKTFASRATHHRRIAVHIPGFKHLAELFQVFFSRRAVRVSPNGQRHVEIDETASNAGEARSLQLSSHGTSHSIEYLPASLGTGRLRPRRLL